MVKKVPWMWSPIFRTLSNICDTGPSTDKRLYFYPSSSIHYPIHPSSDIYLGQKIFQFMYIYYKKGSPKSNLLTVTLCQSPISLSILYASFSTTINIWELSISTCHLNSKKKNKVKQTNFLYNIFDINFWKGKSAVDSCQASPTKLTMFRQRNIFLALYLVPPYKWLSLSTFDFLDFMRCNVRINIM